MALDLEQLSLGSTSRLLFLKSGRLCDIMFLQPITMEP